MNNSKNFWVFLIVLISGLVIGGFLGNTLGGISFFKWLNYGKTIGLTSPLVLDLEVLQINFGITIKFSICGIIGMIVAILLYKKFN